MHCDPFAHAVHPGGMHIDVRVREHVLSMDFSAIKEPLSLSLKRHEAAEFLDSDVEALDFTFG